MPVLLDLKAHGETTSQILFQKTADTGAWDLVIKSMIGVYDTTRYGSIPFIYIGILPLIFSIYYFFSKKSATVAPKQKLAFLLLLLFLIVSFYFEPFNLFWQGFKAPYMFLFRYAYLLSFMLIVLACYGLENYQSDDFLCLILIAFLLIGLFYFVGRMRGTSLFDSYHFLTTATVYLTCLFTAAYLIAFLILYLFPLNLNCFALVLLVVFLLELGLNTQAVFKGIFSDWNYQLRTYYEKKYQPIQTLVETAKAQEQLDTFYRLENLAPISVNESLNFNYAGISYFSSIRNRYAAKSAQHLGFQTEGTALNQRYAQNTLLGDSLFGIKYLIETDSTAARFADLKVKTVKDKSDNAFSLMSNPNTLPLGMLVNREAIDFKMTDDVLNNQTQLYHALASSDRKYFSRASPTLLSTSGISLTELKNNRVQLHHVLDDSTTVAEIANAHLEYAIDIPAHQQAYFYIKAEDARANAKAILEVDNQVICEAALKDEGFYLNLGYYAAATQLKFTLRFDEVDSLRLDQPEIVFLDCDQFRADSAKIQANAIDFKVNKRGAEAEITASDNQMVWTSLPYDKSFKLYIDGKRSPIKAFDQGLLMFEVPKGTHKIRLVYLPQGFETGVLGLIIGMAGMYLTQYNLKMIKEKWQQLSHKKSIKLG